MAPPKTPTSHQLAKEAEGKEAAQRQKNSPRSQSTDQSLSSLLVKGDWDNAYQKLLNAPQPHSFRHLKKGGKLLPGLVDSRSPSHLEDLAAQLFPQDIVKHKAIHLAIVSTARRKTDTQEDSRTEIVKVLLENLNEYLGRDKKKLCSYLVGTRHKFQTALNLACSDQSCSLEMVRCLVEAAPDALVTESWQFPEKLSPRSWQVVNSGTEWTLSDKMIYVALAIYIRKRGNRSFPCGYCKWPFKKAATTIRRVLLYGTGMATCLSIAGFVMSPPN